MSFELVLSELPTGKQKPQSQNWSLINRFGKLPNAPLFLSPREKKPENYDRPSQKDTSLWSFLGYSLCQNQFNTQIVLFHATGQHQSPKRHRVVLPRRELGAPSPLESRPVVDSLGSLKQVARACTTGVYTLLSKNWLCGT